MTQLKPVVVGTHPLNFSLEYMQERCNLISIIKDKHKNAVVLIMGDFNLSDINWETLKIDQHQNLKEINEIFLDTIQNLNLEQIIKNSTRLNNTLDLFLTNRL